MIISVSFMMQLLAIETEQYLILKALPGVLVVLQGWKMLPEEPIAERSVARKVKKKFQMLVNKKLPEMKAFEFSK